jgi:carbonic anhydrase
MNPLPPDESLKRLIEGNQRFATDKALRPNATPSRRAEITKGQQPFAMVLGCVDSRVPPELIFDCGLGDLFVIRTAGQVLDRAVLGSLQFGVAELHLSLLVVLGHSQCGAVHATIEASKTFSPVEGDIRILVEAIQPAVDRARHTTGDVMDHAVRANVEILVKRLKSAPVLTEAVRQGALKIIGAYYSLETGKVEIIVP